MEKEATRDKAVLVCSSMQIELTHCCKNYLQKGASFRPERTSGHTCSMDSILIIQSHGQACLIMVYMCVPCSVTCRVLRWHHCKDRASLTASAYTFSYCFLGLWEQSRGRVLSSLLFCFTLYCCYIKLCSNAVTSAVSCISPALLVPQISVLHIAIQLLKKKWVSAFKSL